MATEDHVTIRKTRRYKAKLGFGFFTTVFSKSRQKQVSREVFKRQRQKSTS